MAMKRRAHFLGNREQLAIVSQLIEERDRQDQQWGGKEHDDTRTRREWLDSIREHADRARKAIGRVCEPINLDEYRHRLVVMAALCVAALEAHDRDMRNEKERAK